MDTESSKSAHDLSLPAIKTVEVGNSQLPLPSATKHEREETSDEALSFNPATEIKVAHQLVKSELIAGGVESDKISRGEIRESTILYLVYWFYRLRNNNQEQDRIGRHLIEYIGKATSDPNSLAVNLVTNVELQKVAKKYVETLMISQKTVDLVITPVGSEDSQDKTFLAMQRSYYPFGLALPGGFIKDTDETNNLDVTPELFAALRIAGEKVLGLGTNAVYEKSVDAKGQACFIVHGETSPPLVRLYLEDIGRFHFRENVKATFRPSDPRHVVDTIGFKCEIEGEPVSGFSWQNKNAVMDSEKLNGGFALGHHREIVAQVTSRSTVEKEQQINETEFIRGLIQNPLERYNELKKRFEANGNSDETNFPELFPVVDQLFKGMFSDEINTMCKKDRSLKGIRDKTVIHIRQTILKDAGVVLPYRPTIDAIAHAVAFFDLVARNKRDFYDSLPSDSIIEHNPRDTKNASYHMYRYEHRLNSLKAMLPHEIIIPTFESLSATDLLKVRSVPIRFLGISTDFLYVDEFEQSPEEFMMHDANHSWRMAQEDLNVMEERGWTREQLVAESTAFSQEYLAKIKILKTDSEEQREMKKLKKIILFEIVHEDARPFLKDIVCKYVQQQEGGHVPFSVPFVDKNTGYMNMVKTLDTGISTLSYVRNKLQHGFYDQVDAQLPQIVDPKYRTARWIAKAAYDMLVELNALPVEGAEVDESGHVSFEWLLRRTCAVGPDNVHEATMEDPDVGEYGDKAIVNLKRYQMMSEKSPS